MRIVQLQLYVLIWCQAAETLDQLTDLGQNVTINCDLNAHEVYWVSLKQSESPTVILKSFSYPTLPFYYKTLKTKYSVQSKHRLVIYNVTLDDLGVYYCMNTDTDKPPKFSNRTRLHITEPTQLTVLTEHKNHTDFTLKEENWTRWKTCTLMFGLLNGALIITVIKLLKVPNGCWKRSGNSSRQHHKTDLQQTQVTEDPQDPNQVQYAAVDFSKLRKNIHHSQDNSIYATLKLPTS